MKPLSTLGVAMRTACLVGLFALTGGGREAQAAEPTWGHCVLMYQWWEPAHYFCECREGPGSQGQYNCMPEGTPCEELFPVECYADL